MKKMIIIFIICISVIFLNATNLIQNPGFENWDGDTLNYWKIELSCSIAKETIIVHSGIYTISITTTSSNNRGICQYIDVNPNDTFLLSEWLYSDDSGTNGLGMFVTWRSSDSSFISSSSTIYNNQISTWEKVVDTILSPDNAVYADIKARGYKNTGLAGYVDDVIFEKLNSSGANYPPVISNVQRNPDCPQDGEIVNIYAQITDDYGLSMEKMYYKYNNALFSNVLSDSVVGNIYYFHTTSGDAYDTLYYYIYALDDSSASTYSDTFFVVIGQTINNKSVLFDFTREEDAGNADWVIDDNMPYPSPSNPLNETDWLGAISSWAFELYTAGYTVSTLPPDSAITYGNANNTLDLSNFKVFVVCEPQNLFTYNEKKAIYDFIRGGGGVFFVSDHNSADRNGNGWDSPRIFNDMKLKDSVGIHCDTTGESYNSISDNSTNYTYIPPTSSDPIFNGPFGYISGPLCFHVGTTMQLSGSAEGEVWYSSVPIGSNYGVMMATSSFGNGRIILITDSSPADDGTGNSGNSLNDGWNEGEDRLFFLNGTEWLTGYNGSSAIKSKKRFIKKEINYTISRKTVREGDKIGINIINPYNHLININMYNISGSKMCNIYNGDKRDYICFKIPDISSGVYFIKSNIKNANIYQIQILK